MLELAIVGGGIAGVTAAIYAKRAGFENYKFFEKGMLGGQIKYIDKIDNFPGVPLGTSGAEFSMTMQGQLKDLEIEPVHEEIEKISRSESGTFVLYTSDGKEYDAKAVICAAGAAPRTLGLEAEEEFMGKGVSYCAICDGFFFRNKTVAVVGGGNTALEEALYLSKLAKKVYIIHRRDEFRAFGYISEQIKSRDNIEVKWDSVVESISGEELLNKVVLKNTQDGSLSDLEIDGLFVAIGYTPSTAVFRDLVETDDAGFVLVGTDMATSSEGIFACGDCIKKDLKQLITSAAEGAIASMSAYNHIQGI